MSLQMIDVRSDTVTKPTPAMLEAMMAAAVGDDVYGEDETVNELQTRAAELFGMQAALYCPTGTMTNQIGIKVHTQPGDEVICHELAHIYVSEGGGCCWELAEIGRIRQACDEHGLALHLDGARLFNAMTARGESPRQFGQLFDTISVCLSKGLGAPAGSLLLGSRDRIAKAHRYRKAMGGGMRQCGYFAAAGLFALEHHVERLREDHARAKAVEAELRSLPYVSSVLPVHTNIVIFNLVESLTADAFLAKLREHHVEAGSTGRHSIRFVFHLDVGDTQVDALTSALRAI